MLDLSPLSRFSEKPLTACVQQICLSVPYQKSKYQRNQKNLHKNVKACHRAVNLKYPMSNIVELLLFVNISFIIEFCVESRLGEMFRNNFFKPFLFMTFSRRSLFLFSFFFLFLFLENI